MVTLTVLSCMTLFANLCVLGSCNCSHGIVEGILGEAVKLCCKMSSSCSSLPQWWIGSKETTPMVVGNTKHASSQIVQNSCELHIFNVTVYDAGSYNCSCVGDSPENYQNLCSTSLLLICRAEVVVNGKIYSHTSDRTNPSPEVTINANVTDSLKVKCPDSANPQTNCKNLRIGESARFTPTLRVSSDHDLCRITCQTRRENRVLCSITFILNISMTENYSQPSTASTTVSSTPATENKIPFTTIPSEKMTHSPSATVKKKKEKDTKSVTQKPAPFSVIIVVIILILISLVVVITVVVFIVSRSSSSQSTKSVNSINPSTNANIPIGLTYATVNKSSKGFLKGDDRLIEPEVLSTDGFYSEVGDAVQEESTTHQPNSKKAGTSITNDYYSEINTSDVKLKTIENGQGTDSTLYSEVNKGEKQPRQKECTSSQQSPGDDPSVSDVPIYHILEESERSEKDTEDDVSTSQDLYAVVDTDA